MVLNKTDWDKFESETGTKPDFSTWESIAAIAEKYYNWTDLKTPEPDDGKAFFGRDAMANYMLIGAKQLGVELVQVENEEVTYNLDKDVLRRLWDNYYVPYIKGYYASIGRFRSDDAKTGDIIALVGSTSGASYFPTEVKKNDGSSYPIEAAVYPLPVFEGAKRWLDLYFQGKQPDFFPALHMQGTPFQKLVWELLLQIPYGETITYVELAGQIAAQLGRTSMSAQAVGGAVGHNKISILIPCHRVVGRDQSLTGYAGGLERKKWLLELEKGKHPVFPWNCKGLS